MRPQLHFTAEHGWINDPHGITFHGGRYHLFHQFVPDSMVHDPACRWGHAVGIDLVSWSHRPVALAPGDGDDGIWTGCLASGDEGPVILYTSVQSRNYDMGWVRRATPVDDSWDTWRKEEIVVEPPVPERSSHFGTPLYSEMAVGGVSLSERPPPTAGRRHVHMSQRTSATGPMTASPSSVLRPRPVLSGWDGSGSAHRSSGSPATSIGR